MQKNLISFFISALIGLGLGYIAFDVVGGGTDEPAEVTQQGADTSQSESKNEAKEDQPVETVSADSNILSTKGCLGCHSVSALNLEGGATGPDLSNAFGNVEGKHGKAIDQFLKEPTSAVMSGVIAGSPLSEEEITEVVKVLEEASQK